MLIIPILTRKINREFAEQMNFDVENIGRPSTRDGSVIRLLHSPAIMDWRISKTRFLSTDPKELCDRLKLFLQEKKAGKNSNINGGENIVIKDKLSEYKCISTKQR